MPLRFVMKNDLENYPRHGMGNLEYNNTLDDIDDWWFYPIGDDGMQKVNVYAFYRFGKRLKEAGSVSLQPVLEQFEFNGQSPQIDATRMLAAMETIYAGCLVFLKDTEGCVLPKSCAKIAEIKELHIRYWKLIGNAIDANDDEERTALFTRWLRQANRLTDDFEEILKHEVDRINAFVTTQKGSHDTEILAERAEESYSAETRKYLSAHSIYDFKEAGKCLLFDCYTAMGYHIFRGTEALMLRYYEVLAGKVYSGAPGWGSVESALTAKKFSVPHDILITLSQMRVHLRNGIAHPDFIIEADEALPFYNIAQLIIPRIAKEIEKLEAMKISSPSTSAAVP